MGCTYATKGRRTPVSTMLVVETTAICNRAMEDGGALGCSKRSRNKKEAETTRPASTVLRRSQHRCALRRRCCPEKEGTNGMQSRLRTDVDDAAAHY